MANPTFVPSGEIARAVKFAIENHGDQTRKASDIPYLQHLLGVASIALEFGADETETVAAVLHDVIEDTPVDEAELEREFGPEVTAIVMSCSAEAKSDEDAVESWRRRKQDYIDHLSEASASAVLVSLADKIHNARSIAADRRRAPSDEEFWGRFNASRDEQVWYYRSLIELYEDRVTDADSRISDSMVAELCEAVAEFHDLTG